MVFSLMNNLAHFEHLQIIHYNNYNIKERIKWQITEISGINILVKVESKIA